MTERRDGHSKLVWDKDAQALKAVDPHPESAPPPARVMMWQPISTAPKGEELFLVCGVGDDRGAFVARGEILWNARKANTPSHLHLHYLTHWMPLPDPPVSS